MRNLSRRQYAALRKVSYALGPSLSAVLVAFGIWTSDQAAVVAGVVTAILPNILAFFNTDPGMYEDPSGDTSAEPGGSAESGE
jgi:hypothetical protein|nr:MAG TPA: hypothetical protein [Caudoviricetes sp.]